MVKFGDIWIVFGVEYKYDGDRWISAFEFNQLYSPIFT